MQSSLCILIISRAGDPFVLTANQPLMTTPETRFLSYSTSLSTPLFQRDGISSPAIPPPLASHRLAQSGTPFGFAEYGTKCVWLEKIAAADSPIARITMRYQRFCDAALY